MTLTKLKKTAKDCGFSDKMEALGFILGPSGFWFYRQRREFLDVFDFWLGSSGKWVEVPVVCYVDELITHYDMAKFPKGFTKNLSCLTNLWASRDGFGYSSDAWKVSDEVVIKASFLEGWKSRLTLVQGL